MPWSIIFYYVLFLNLKLIFTKFVTINPKHIATLYLVGSFIPTFILFSLTTFQLDHYTNIIIPFAAILCANWLTNFRISPQGMANHPLFYIQIAFAYILTAIIILLSLFIFGHEWIMLVLLVGLVILILYICFAHKDDLIKAFLYPVLAIGLLFIFLIEINKIAIKYDLGYQSAKIINHSNDNYPVVDFDDNSLTLQFYIHNKYLNINTPKLLQQVNKPYYLIVKEQQLLQLNLGNYEQLSLIQAATIDRVIANLLTRSDLKNMANTYVVLLIK